MTTLQEEQSVDSPVSKSNATLTPAPTSALEEIPGADIERHVDFVGLQSSPNAAGPTSTPLLFDPLTPGHHHPLETTADTGLVAAAEMTSSAVAENLTRPIDLVGSSPSTERSVGEEPSGIDGGGTFVASRGLRILFLSSDTGGGHRASAESLAAQFLRLYPGSTYHLLDVVSECGIHPYSGLVGWYSHLSKNPAQWNIVYKVSNTRAFRTVTDVQLRLLTERAVRRTIAASFVGEGGMPDVVVSVHPMMCNVPALACQNISSQSGRHLPMFTVVTDLGSGHAMWFDRNVERMFIASEQIKMLAKSKGKVEDDKLVMSGLPIRRDFAMQAEAMGEGGRKKSEGIVHQKRVRDGLGLIPGLAPPASSTTPSSHLSSSPPHSSLSSLCPSTGKRRDHRVVLVMGGGEGCGALGPIVDALYVELARQMGGSTDATIVVVCGRNAALKEALETRDWTEVMKKAIEVQRGILSGIRTKTARRLRRILSTPGRMEDLDIDDQRHDNEDDDDFIDLPDDGAGVSKAVCEIFPDAPTPSSDAEAATAAKAKQAYPRGYGVRAWRRALNRGTGDAEVEAPTKGGGKSAAAVEAVAESKATPGEREEAEREGYRSAAVKALRRAWGVGGGDSAVVAAAGGVAEESITPEDGENFKGDPEATAGLIRQDPQTPDHLDVNNCEKFLPVADPTIAPVNGEEKEQERNSYTAIAMKRLRHIVGPVGALSPSSTPTATLRVEGGSGGDIVEREVEGNSIGLGATVPAAVTNNTKKENLMPKEKVESLTSHEGDANPAVLPAAPSEDTEEKNSEGDNLGSLPPALSAKDVEEKNCGKDIGSALLIKTSIEEKKEDEHAPFVPTPKRSAMNARVIVHPLGFVTRMSEYMVAADILISKAGPGTIAEAASVGLPVLLTSFLPGQEEGNVDFVVENGFGGFVPDNDPSAVAREAAGWLSDPERLAELSLKATEAGSPNAAEDIVRAIGKSVVRWKELNELNEEHLQLARERTTSDVQLRTDSVGTEEGVEVVEGGKRRECELEAMEDKSNRKSWKPQWI